MIRPEQIPDEVVEAAVSAYNYASSDCYTTEGQDIRAAIAAGLAVWPGMIQHEHDALDPVINPLRLILPLPQEPSDE